ncbi:MAG: PAS domain S-box protein [Pseudolabrys sp.]|nr:PAS domain S-box protein [Pseudolabrys sp.]
MTILSSLTGKTARLFTTVRTAIGGMDGSDNAASNKSAEQNLLLNEALGNMTHGFCLFDADNRLQLWNNRFADMYRLQGKLRVGQTLSEILQLRKDAGTLVENAEEYTRRVTQAVRKGETFRHSFKLQDGRTISLSNEARKTGGWISTHEDITGMVQREASFHLLFESNPLPMWVHDQETLKFLAINDAALNHYGYSREQCLAMTILDFKLPEDRAALRKMIGERDYREGFASRHVKADGTPIDVSVFARSMQYEGRPAGFCAMIDLTAHNLAEAEVRRTRKFLDSIIENVPSNIIVKELPSLRYLLVNRAGEKYFRLPRKKMIGKTVTEIFPKETADIIHARDMFVLESGEELFVDEHDIVTPADGKHIVTTTRIPVRGDDVSRSI